MKAKSISLPLCILGTSQPGIELLSRDDNSAPASIHQLNRHFVDCVRVGPATPLHLFNGEAERVVPINSTDDHCVRDSDMITKRNPTIP